MKKYMLIVLFEGETSTHFYDEYIAASNARMDAECGLGAYAELYERTTDEDGMTAYTLID